MSYFLWVEDFENSPIVTASNVFGGVLNDDLFVEDKRAIKKSFKDNGVFVELNFQDGFRFIQSGLDKKIDYVILDIDLPAYGADGINEHVLQLLTDFENYQAHEDETEDEQLQQKACAELKKIAGFYLYTKLVVELGFPKQHILFCSNHGENTKTIQEAFKTAKISLPKIHQKSDADVQQWVKECFENPYSRLRRGIIQACQFLKDKKLRFDAYGIDSKKPATLDVENYLAILSDFLPLCEPDEKHSKYKLFVRTLAHEWDEAVRPKKLGDNKVDKQVSFAFSWIMKITRNWSAHSNVFDQISAQDVAFLFIVNMRAMFALGSEPVPYEIYLFSLFDLRLSENEFKTICGRDYKDRKIPLTQKYASLLQKYGTNYEAINFHDLLNELQKKQLGKNDFLIEGLYQVFWFLTSYGRVYIDPHKIQEQKYLNYQFEYFNYFDEAYLADIGRHIYSRSFGRSNP